MFGVCHSQCAYQLVLHCRRAILVAGIDRNHTAKLIANSRLDGFKPRDGERLRGKCRICFVHLIVICILKRQTALVGNQLLAQDCIVHGLHVELGITARADNFDGVGFFSILDNRVWTSDISSAVVIA